MRCATTKQVMIVVEPPRLSFDGLGFDQVNTVGRKLTPLFAHWLYMNRSFDSTVYHCGTNCSNHLVQSLWAETVPVEMPELAYDYYAVGPDRILSDRVSPWSSVSGYAETLDQVMRTMTYPDQTAEKFRSVIIKLARLHQDSPSQTCLAISGRGLPELAVPEPQWKQFPALYSFQGIVYTVALDKNEQDVITKAELVGFNKKASLDQVRVANLMEGPISALELPKPVEAALKKGGFTRVPQLYYSLSRESLPRVPQMPKTGPRIIEDRLYALGMRGLHLKDATLDWIRR